MMLVKKIMSRACKGAQQLIQQTAVGAAAAHFNQQSDEESIKATRKVLVTIYFYFCFQQPSLLRQSQ